MAELHTRYGVVVSVEDDRADTLDGPYWRPAAEGGGAAPAQGEKKPEPKRATRRGDDDK